MIEVLLDNNALQKLCKSNEFDDILKRINSLYNSGKLGINFNVFPFLEQIANSKSDKAFGYAVKRIQQSDAITARNFLLPVDEHARKAAGILSGSEAVELTRSWFAVFREISLCKNKNDLSPRISRLIDSFIDKKREFAVNMEESKSSTEKMFFQVPVIELKSVIFSSLVRNTGLETARHLYTDDAEFVKKVYCLCIYSNIFLEYVNGIVEGTRSVRESDWVDLLQTIYLDSCDYIVTSDKRYQDLINNCAFDVSLSGRAINYDEFIRQLQEPVFLESKRAPFNMSRIRFN